MKIVRDIRFVFFALCAVISLVLLFVPETKQQNLYVSTASDSFDPTMSRITSIEHASKYIDSVYHISFSGKFDTIEYVRRISSFVKLKFCHGIAHYSLSENWIAHVLGKYTWSHLSAKVDPDDIMKQSNGLCSQQAMVFMEILEKNGIKCRSVGLGYKEGPGHFLTEVYYNGQWHLYDVNKEPKWEKIKNHHMSMDYYRQNKDTLYLAYEDQMEKNLFYKIMEQVQYGLPGEFSAKNMRMFHKITNLFTYLLPVLFFALAVRRGLRLRSVITEKIGKSNLVTAKEKDLV